MSEKSLLALYQDMNFSGGKMLYVVCPKSKGTDFPMYKLAT